MSIVNLDLQQKNLDAIQDVSMSILEQIDGFTTRKTKNLFNKEAVLVGYDLNSSGNTILKEGYNVSDFIQVNNSINSSVYIRYVVVVCKYDKSKNFLGLQYGRLVNISDGETAYIRFSYLAANHDNQQVEYGTSFTGYEEYSPYRIFEEKVIHNEATSMLQAIDWGDNLCNGKNISKNSYIKEDGSLGSLSGYEVTDYIPVFASVYPTIKQQMYYSINIQSDSYTRIAFYDKEMKFIEGSFASSLAINAEILIPINAAWCRIGCQSHATYPNLYIVNYSDRFKGLLGQIYTGPRLREEKEVKGNLIDRNSLLREVRINYSDGTMARNFSFVASPFIEVKYGHRYFCNTVLYNDYNDRIWEYDKDYNPISYAERNPFYTPTSADVRYVAFIYASMPSEDTFIGFIDAADWDGEIGTMVSTDGKYEERQVSKGFPIDGHYFAGAYGEHKVIQRYASGRLYYINGDIRNAEVLSISLNSGNFTGLPAGTVLTNIMFFNTLAGVRSLVFFDKNYIYCSTTGAFSGFEVPNIWDLKGRRHWRISDDDKDPTGERYRAYFPSDYHNGIRQKAFEWHNGPVWMNGIGGQYSRGLLFANYTNTYAPNTALPSCVFYTEDGKNIYIQYMFGVYQKYYKTSDETTEEKSSVNYNLGDDVDFSALGTYSGGLTLKKRWNILPSESLPDPTNVFEYSDAVNITAISGQNITLENASTIRIGDTIIIQGTTGMNLDKVTNNNATAENGGTTAFVVKSKSGNVITIADAIGNVANNLMCRHIHGIQEFGEGIVFYTGEEYPESYIMYMNPYQNSNIDGDNINNNRWFEDVVRLNSGKNAYQRGLGVYLRSDGKIVFIADSNSPQMARLSVRNKEIKMGNYGIHVFELADIDNATSISKIQGLNAGYALYYIMGILFFSDYKGKTHYSEDEGDTWKFLSVDGLTKSIHLGFTNMEQAHFFETNKTQVMIKRKS